MQDMQITCAGCGGTFAFTAAEQAFYAERGFQAPKRCRRCRQARRSGRGGTGTGGGGGGRGTKAASGRQAAASGRRAAAEAAARSTYTVHCAGCGQQTEVPFALEEERQVFCPACFRTRCAELVGAGEED